MSDFTNIPLQWKNGPFREECAAVPLPPLPHALPSNHHGKFCRSFSITGMCSETWLTTASALRTKMQIVETHPFHGKWQISDLLLVPVSAGCKVLPVCIHYETSRNNCFVVLFDTNDAGWKVHLRLAHMLSTSTPEYFSLGQACSLPPRVLYSTWFTRKKVHAFMSLGSAFECFFFLEDAVSRSKFLVSADLRERWFVSCLPVNKIWWLAPIPVWPPFSGGFYMLSI